MPSMPNQNEAGNMYLNGAKNMADAIRQSQNNSDRANPFSGSIGGGG